MTDILACSLPRDQDWLWLTKRSRDPEHIARTVFFQFHVSFYRAMLY